MIAGLVVGGFLILTGAGLLLALRHNTAPAGQHVRRRSPAAVRHTTPPAPRVYPPLPELPRPVWQGNADAVNAAVTARLDAGLPGWISPDTATRRPDDTVRFPRYTGEPQ